MRLLTLKEACAQIGIPVPTLKCWLTKGICPFTVRQAPSGKLYMAVEDIEAGIEAMAGYRPQRRKKGA